MGSQRHVGAGERTAAAQPERDPRLSSDERAAQDARGPRGRDRAFPDRPATASPVTDAAVLSRQAVISEARLVVRHGAPGGSRSRERWRRCRASTPSCSAPCSTGRRSRARTPTTTAMARATTRPGPAAARPRVRDQRGLARSTSTTVANDPRHGAESVDPDDQPLGAYGANSNRKGPYGLRFRKTGTDALVCQRLGSNFVVRKRQSCCGYQFLLSRVAGASPAHFLTRIQAKPAPTSHQPVGLLMDVCVLQDDDMFSTSLLLS